MGLVPRRCCVTCCSVATWPLLICPSHATHKPEALQPVRFTSRASMDLGKVSRNASEGLRPCLRSRRLEAVHAHSTHRQVLPRHHLQLTYLTRCSAVRRCGTRRPLRPSAPSSSAVRLSHRHRLSRTHTWRGPSAAFEDLRAYSLNGIQRVAEAAASSGPDDDAIRIHELAASYHFELI